ncbi:MAG: tol-pal system YbgF family protein [Waddliaceae bacterium]
MMSVSRPLICLIGLALGCLTYSCGCHPRSCLLEPAITYTPQRQQFERGDSPFDELSPIELKQDWGKEMKIAIALARELDLYRAITGFKRALILMPAELKNRRLQAQFYIVQSYYLGRKYQSAVEAFEFSKLPSASGKFPPFRELLIILYESYEKTGQCEKAQAILSLMEKGDPETALDLKLFSAVDAGDFNGIATLALAHPHREDFSDFVGRYRCCCKSVRQAQTLNAILPGAGYYYVGQKRSALTSFVLNTAFIAASYHFFEKGNWGAGLFTSSLELGWYFGGINGAGLAAKEYNQCIYQDLGKELMLTRRLFPVLMLETSF